MLEKKCKKLINLTKNFEYFNGLEHGYKKKLQGEQQSNNTSRTENHITKKYHKDLRKLMIKTRNPNLLADIVRENIPMDMTCVSASTQVVYKILKAQGVAITGLTIIVKGDYGIGQEFSMSEGAEKIVIPLKLKDNHFEFCGGSTSENNGSSGSNNNCLYEALSEAIPGLRDIITPEEFRAEVANCIEHDEGIRYHIQQGWHQLPISLGAFGGFQREPSELAHDIESSSYDNEYLDYEEYRYRVRDVHAHIEDRFTRYFCAGGVIQRVSEQAEIRRDKVVKTGASQYQDQSSNRGREVHAAHIVRLGRIHPKIVNQYKQLYKEFKNFLGHTQNVPKYANEWHGIGGDIDKFQSKHLKELGRINFSGSLTTEDASTIKIVKEDFIVLLDNRIDGGKYSDIEKSEFIKTKTALTNATIELLFEKGNKGYLGEGMHVYR